MSNELKRPYYDPSVLANKRQAENAALLKEIEAAIKFSTCVYVVNVPTDLGVDIQTEAANVVPVDDWTIAKAIFWKRKKSKA